MLSDEEKREITLFIRFWSVLFRKQREVGSFGEGQQIKVLTEGGSFIKFDEVFLPVIDVQTVSGCFSVSRLI